MKLYLMMLWLVLAGSLAAGCGKEDATLYPDAPAEVSLDIKFSPPDATSRAAGPDRGLVGEEGEVREIIYAVFKDGGIVAGPTLIPVRKPDGSSYHTGDTYRITGLDPSFFLEGHTEIFVVANPDKERAYLLDGTHANIRDWKGCTYWQNMNAEVKKNASRMNERPVMAGYLSLNGIASSVITVPVEHIYSRIWFTFGWRGTPETDELVIDKVTVSNLMYRTLTFNSSNEVGGYNPDPTGTDRNKWQEVRILDSDRADQPFLACLDPENGEYHFGDTPRMLLTAATRNSYNILCRYSRKGNGEADMNRPVRYYIYCFQWDGTTLEDDPLIVVDYHFTPRPQFPGDTPEPVYKRAAARMYDPNYKPGKRHHGILRNYTYQVYCLVNSTTNKLDLQVTAHWWTEHQIDDIPPFE